MKTSITWTLFLKRFFLLLLLYSIFRFLFLVVNYSTYSNYEVMKIGYAFLEGLRFDLWTTAWTLLPIFLVVVFFERTFEKKWMLLVQQFYILAVSFWNFGLNAIDLELFKFTGKRLSIDWLLLQQDVKNQTWGLVQYYWWAGCLGFILWIVLFKVWSRWDKSHLDLNIQFQKQGRPQDLFSKIRPSLVIRNTVFCAFYILSLRGGWQHKPLSLSSAYGADGSAMGVLRMNSTFSFFKSRLGSKNLQIRFYENQECKRNQILQERIKAQSEYFGKFKGMNVVLLLIESLGTEYVGGLNPGSHSRTPFLDQILKSSVVFPFHLANGRRSIEAIPSLICGIPSLMGQAFLASAYQSTNIKCLPQELKKTGYTSHFFHGAYNGSMHFDVFSERAGFDYFYGFNEFNDSSQFDGHWGIFDEPMLHFMRHKLSQSQQPFFSTFFSLSSHSPYPLPSDRAGKYKEGDLEIHKSIEYVDDSLKSFFDEAQKEPWFKNTIFILTGDHTQKSVIKKYQSDVGVYRVPLIIYGEPLKKNNLLQMQSTLAVDAKLNHKTQLVDQRINIASHNADTLISGARSEGLNKMSRRVTQHIDVTQTVLDLLGVKSSESTLLSKSVFAKDEGFAINGGDSGYWIVTPSRFTQIKAEGLEFLSGSFHWDDEKLSLDPVLTLENTDLELLKAIVDRFNQGVVQNSLLKNDCPDSASH